MRTMRAAPYRRGAASAGVAATPAAWSARAMPHGCQAPRIRCQLRRAPRRDPVWKRIDSSGRLGETTCDHAEECVWNAAANGRAGNGILADHGRHGFDRGGTHEGAPPRQHLVRDHAKRELVGAEVRRSSGCLLGRHVADRSKDHAFEGRINRRRAVASTADVEAGIASTNVRRARPKSRIFARPSAASIRFSGLRSRWTTPLACAAASPSAICSAIAHAWRISSGPPDRHLSQGAPVDPFHRDPGDAVGVSDVVHGDDGRVIQGGCGPGLGLEATTKGRVSHQPWRNDLEGDVASQPRIATAIDLSHPADAEKRLDLRRGRDILRSPGQARR